MKEEILKEYGLQKSNLNEYGGYIGDKYYFCCNPSKMVAEFAFDYRLFKINGVQVFYAPIVRMKDICQDCKNLTSGYCYRHRESI